MGALVFEEDEIPSSPANWGAFCVALGRRYLLWLRARHAVAPHPGTPVRTRPGCESRTALLGDGRLVR
jgi:hypothetical protein